MSFDLWALLLALALGLLFFWLSFRKNTFQEATLSHSALNDFDPSHPPLRARLAWIPRGLYLLANVFLLLAFLDPHTFKAKKQEAERRQDPTEGRVIFLALDQSGSMTEPAERNLSKIELMRAVMENFVKERPNDLLGLVSFARVVRILAPPTLDHDAILKEIASLATVSEKDQDGTAIGYAIFKTANLIASLKEQANLLGKEAPYHIQGAVVVLVTDGLQDPNPLDKDNPYRSMELEQAANYAKSKGVTLYIINIAPELGSAKYLPNLKQMRQIAEMTHGKFYHASSASDVPQFVADINDIETSQIYETPDASALPTVFKRHSYYLELLFVAFFLLLTGALLDETLFRRSLC